MTKNGLSVNTRELVFFDGEKEVARIDLVYCMLPNGFEGYRLDIPFQDDLGTIVYDEKNKTLVLVNW